MIGAIKQDYIVDGDDDYGILPGDAPLYERVPASTWAALTDSEIARRAGVTRERVRQVRNKYGILPSKLHGKRMVGRRREHNKPQAHGHAPIVINGFKVRRGGGNEGSS